jgi:hypothetical protein
MYKNHIRYYAVFNNLVNKKGSIGITNTPWKMWGRRGSPHINSIMKKLSITHFNA